MIYNRSLSDAQRMVESKMDYCGWRNKIPYIKFPSNWEIQIIPPFTGAMVRFRVKLGAKSVSVYLDCYDNLGCFGEPYWEIYPDKDDNNLRFAMGDTKELLKAIKQALKHQPNNLTNN